MNKRLCFSWNVPHLVFCLVFGLLLSPLFAPTTALAEDIGAPSGFIAVSESAMNWADANAFCNERGGKLPLVGGLAQWDGLNPPSKDIPIDGFGNKGRPWDELGLPAGSYWTGTVSPDDPDTQWIVEPYGGNVDFSDRLYDSRVVCVP